DRCTKQLHRAGAERPPSLTDWISPGPELIPGKLLWILTGIHPPRARRLSDERRRSGFLLCFHHGHEAILDRVGRLCRTQAQRECFVQRVAFGDEVFGFLPEFLSSFLELLEFFRLQRSDHVKSGLI